MKNMLLTVLLVTAGMLVASGPLLAHHSQAYFNNEVVTTVSGTVKEFNWMNPHSILVLSAKDDKGQMADWIIELAPPNSLQRDNGWSKTTFKTGDQVTIDGHPYKDGRNIMRPVRFVLPDGKQLKGRF